MTTPAHLHKTHPQYPKGFPDRVDDDLLGHWETATGTVVVENHPHGYEIHFGPCLDYDNCEACAPDRGPSNPNSPDDGHHFRLCPNTTGPIVTVAGGEEGRRAVLEYLAFEGSQTHIDELAAVLRAEADEESEMRAREAAEHEAQMAEQESFKPSPEERLSAIEAELAALRETL